MTILVIGARGHVGGAVVQGLLAAGEHVRASSRDPKPGDLPDEVDVVRADLTDPDSLPAALAGVAKVFLYAQPQSAAAFAAAAKRARVKHVVLLSSASVVFPDAASNPIAQQHVVVERALQDAGVPSTFVRPGYFATNALRWQSIRTERVLRTAFPDASTLMVHERDIADVAVHALLDSAHQESTNHDSAYAVLGAGPLSVRDQVAAISGALGEPVRVEQLDEESYRRQLLSQLPAPIAELALQSRGEVPGPAPELATDAVPELLGRPALAFAEWARDHAEDFR